MKLFTQKPRHLKKKKTSRIYRGDERTQRTTRSSAGNNGARSGLSFSIPSTIAVTVFTVLISFAVINWEPREEQKTEGENKNIQANSKIKPHKVSLPEQADITANDHQVSPHTITYAKTGLPNIFLPVNIQNQTANSNMQSVKSETEKSETTENSALVSQNEPVKNDNPHGSLVIFEWQQYRVQKGDTVSGIAQKHKVSVGAIIASNEIRNARKLQEGTVLRIPNIDGIPYQIKKGDNLSGIASSHKIPLEVLLDVNDIKSDIIKAGEKIFLPGARMNDIDLRLSLGELFMYPINSRYITSNYGMRKEPFTGVLQFHDGVDFRANTGTTIMAAMDGVVAVVGTSRLYGKHIILSHSNGYKTLYGHLNSFNVKEGDKVTRGRKIGESGNTGYSTGPHLHFGAYDKNGKLVNPLELLK